MKPMQITRIQRPLYTRALGLYQTRMRNVLNIPTYQEVQIYANTLGLRA
jgi:hypothetical protein